MSGEVYYGYVWECWEVFGKRKDGNGHSLKGCGIRKCFGGGGKGNLGSESDRELEWEWEWCLDI